MRNVIKELKKKRHVWKGSVSKTKTCFSLGLKNDMDTKRMFLVFHTLVNMFLDIDSPTVSE